MELSKNKLHARFYKFWYKVEELPEDFCNYFWGLLLGVLLFIPLFIGRCIFENTDSDFYSTPSWIKSLTYFFITLVAVMLAACVGAVIGLVLVNPLKSVVITLLFTAFCFFVWGSLTFIESETPKIIITKIKSHKQKICHRITWK